ncbi:MAG TPA: hypothetical protein VI316_07480 [Candidatus Dormibacteraeota bacterium]
MRRSLGAGAALSRQLRRLDSKLGIDHSGRSEWVWAIPAVTLLATLGIVLYMGVATDMGVGVAIPVGLIGGLFMAGMSIAYMTPMDEEPDGEGPEPGSGGDGPPAPRDGGPPASWTSVPAPPRPPDTAGKPQERDAVGASR